MLKCFSVRCDDLQIYRFIPQPSGARVKNMATSSLKLLKMLRRIKVGGTDRRMKTVVFKGLLNKVIKPV